MPAKDGTTTPSAPSAPGAKVVEALANPLAAGFVQAALTEAEAALRAVYTAPAGEGQQRRELQPMQKTALNSIVSLGAQLVTATTVPASTGGGQ